MINVLYQIYFFPFGHKNLIPHPKPNLAICKFSEIDIKGWLQYIHLIKLCNLHALQLLKASAVQENPI